MFCCFLKGIIKILRNIVIDNSVQLVVGIVPVLILAGFIGCNPFRYIFSFNIFYAVGRSG